MLRKIVLLYLNLVCSFCTSFTIDGYDLEENLTWPNEYYFKAEKISLKSGLVEPFEVWYSEATNSTRIDFYDGMVKRFLYQKPNESEWTIYEVHPMSESGLVSVLECQKVMMYGDMEKTYHQLMVLLIKVGETTYDGEVIQIWKCVEEEKEIYKYESILYVFKTEEGVFIPVRLQKKRFFQWNAVLDRHVITNYYGFHTNISADDLDAGKVEECKDVMLGTNLKQDLEVLHPHLDTDVDKAFHSYKAYHGRNYIKREHEIRKLIFEENWSRIVHHNSKNFSYKLEINKFADRLDEELAHLTATRPSDPGAIGTEPFPFTEEELKMLEEELPENYDMRLDGVISPVKDQADCGSCWAFSTTAAIEAAISRRNGGRNIDLSEQSLIDCVWGLTRGCFGGFLYETFKHVTSHGMPTQREYGPYLAQDGYCKLKNMTDVHTIKGFAKVPSLSETALKVVLYKFGPVSVTINAEHSMLYYSSGIYYEPECNKYINHAVTVVGYGVRDGANYWIVKNSWGEDWGEDGYILMSAANNNCFLMTDGYYPIV